MEVGLRGGVDVSVATRDLIANEKVARSARVADAEASRKEHVAKIRKTIDQKVEALDQQIRRQEFASDESSVLSDSGALRDASSSTRSDEGRSLSRLLDEKAALLEIRESAGEQKILEYNPRVHEPEPAQPPPQAGRDTDEEEELRESELRESKLRESEPGDLSLIHI